MMRASQPAPPLSNLMVEGLFGRFHHKVTWPEDARVLLLHGGNGVGKSSLLQMLHQLLQGHFHGLLSQPFHCFRVTFRDDTYLEARKRQEKSPGGEWKLEIHNQAGQSAVVATLPRSGGVTHRLRQLAKEVSGWRWEEDQFLVRIQTGERRSLDEFLVQYGGELPVGLRSVYQLPHPDWYCSVSRSRPIRLLRMQDLLASMSQGSMEWCVTELKERCHRAIRNYASSSYASDLETARTHPDEEEKKSLGRLLDEMTMAGLFARSEPATPRTALSERVTLTASLAKQIILFLRLVNNRFQHKKLRNSAEDGLRIELPDGEPLPFHLLSSGERLLFQLYFTLLFRTTSGEMVCIDEPELSLHVAWQEGFVEDLLAIAGEVGFSALLATHSPQIIGERWDQSVELLDH